MKIERLSVRNLKLLRHFDLEFLRGGEPRSWTVLIGENGTCKTSLLQLIGMAASGASRANQLATWGELRDVRVKSSATVEAQFALEGRHAGPLAPSVPHPGLWSRLECPPASSEVRGRSFYVDSRGERVPTPDEAYLNELFRRQDIYEIERLHQEGALVNWAINSDPLVEWRAQNAAGALVLGYGVSRLLPEPMTSPRPSDLARERLEPLFGRRPLVGTDFVEHLSDRSRSLGHAFARALKSALQQVDTIVPRVADVELRGRGGAAKAASLVSRHRIAFNAGASRSVKLPATWLSQGYQATIAWIADVLGHAFWDANDEVRAQDVRALVLIDELDMHLHPRWQAGYVRALKEVFPEVQFVATTHSPMLLPGLRADEIVRLAFGEGGHIVAQHEDTAPAALTGSGLYDTYFQVNRATPDALAEKLRRLGLLVGDPGRSEEEDAEMHRLMEALEREGICPGWEPVPIDPELQDE